jgi:hypothetical protein
MRRQGKLNALADFLLQERKRRLLLNVSPPGSFDRCGPGPQRPVRLFTNLAGTTDATGAAVATINIPPSMIGGAINLDFAGALLTPVDFVTNAVHITLLP